MGQYGRPGEIAHLATASAAKQRIPHLDPEEVEIIKELLREALFELAAEGEQ
jgi:phage terminase Nu1 subunit (DNA packaging protein)